MSDEPNRIEDVSNAVADKIKPLFGEATDAINEAITAIMEEAAEKREAGVEFKPKLKLSIGVTWALDEQSVDVTMPVNVKRKFQRKVELPEIPGQPQPQPDPDAHFPKALRGLAQAFNPDDKGGE